MMPSEPGSPPRAGGGAEGPFTIERDRVRKLVIITRRGFWNEQDASRYEQAMNFLLATLDFEREQFDVLIDLAEAQPLSHTAAEGVGRVVDAMVRAGLHKSATVSPSAMSRIQVRRILPATEHFAVFSSRDEAMTWLATS